MSQQFQNMLQLLTTTGLATDVNTVNDLVAVDGTHLLYGGLNIVYGIEGSGKSWQTVALVKESNAANVYIDTDGANGKKFVQHCLDNNVVYVGAEGVDKIKSETTILGKITKIVDGVASLNTDNKVIIVDSLTSILEGHSINNAEDISPILYQLNNLAAKHGIALVVIDHATQGADYPDGFKLEGNAGAKKRTTVTTARYLPMEAACPSKGGTFVCERARGNASDIGKGFKVEVLNIDNLQAAYDFLVNKFPTLVTSGSITKTDINKATKNAKDLWVRDQIDNILDAKLVGKTTTYTMKPATELFPA